MPSKAERLSFGFGCLVDLELRNIILAFVQRTNKNKGEYVHCRTLVLSGGCSFADHNHALQKKNIKCDLQGKKAGQGPMFLFERVC